MLLADVIVPLPLKGVYTYSIPYFTEEKVKIGSRVIVQFGKKKFYTAIVCNIYVQDTTKEIGEIKEIVSLLDNAPIVYSNQLEFWNWISFYYMCTLGEVLKAALPAALKLESETFVFRNADFESSIELTPTEKRIFDILSDSKPLKISEIEKLTSTTNVAIHIKSLVDKEAAYINENIKNKHSLKTETFVELAKQFEDDELNSILDKLKRAKKQYQLFLFFLHLKDDSTEFNISKKELIEKSQFTQSVLDGLIEKNILKYKSIEQSRFDYGNSDLTKINLLNEYQQKAYNEITESFTFKSTVLLHGITSSGKTELYIHLIKDAIESGKQVLYMLPEIALTTQITERLKRVFGDKLAVYHSKFSDNERADVWKDLLKENNKQVILGTRSSIFLPFSNLGLIIVDEEHETSFKQQDPSPRYNARDAAIYLAHLHNAKILLGTATPSIETYYNAVNGKFGLVSLSIRHQSIALPNIEVVNTKDLRKRKLMKSVLSPILIEKMTDALTKKEQIILFQNRRGFAPLLECKDCAWTPKCNNCDVSLTYHKNQNILLCHYCGATYPFPHQCPECKSHNLEILGYGTERIEDEVSSLFTDSNILRMDLDTTRGKHSFEKMITDFASHKADILIGTQMVSKGLDFENVSIVGILNADAMLNYPDFRAYERAFQMMTQVSGRAGRKNKQGTVFLQTTMPNNPIITFVTNNDYEALYQLQIEERKLFRYPPFYRLISITVRHRDDVVLQHASDFFIGLLKPLFADNVLGPTKPHISKIQNLFIRKILIKVDAKYSPQKVRDMIEYCKNNVMSRTENKSLLVQFDVDPY